MKYQVVKTYEVEAKSEMDAKRIIAELETKNQQNLFLRWVSAHVADKSIPLWSLW